jgi:hypothetical protein
MPSLFLGFLKFCLPLVLALNISSLKAAEWVLDSSCEPSGFTNRLKEFFQGKDFWRNQLNAGRGEITATYQLIKMTAIDLERSLATSDAKFQAEIAELAVKGIPPDLIAMTVTMSVQNLKKEVELSVMLINETYPEHIRYLEGCIEKIRAEF